ncbi:alpha/beta hydrolase [Stigmatella aurantiaca]|uniref:Conserved uncharacterized protein n=2 Tax=Stigmatella aurantiaca (strain DW4/3-1) TaxID=378806 RepID=E3FEC8_STIAD|nr:alpha/beta hydrolase [Stigmatella aurantiaca]ADO73898.1 conserved uncharacterized protein [Stigmatella aurantiaca DW4/3-1]
MNTIHLVDPSARELVTQLPSVDPERQSVAEFRANLLAIYAQAAPLMPEAREERKVPGPPGTPEVRVLIYRPTPQPQPFPAILYIHGGGMIGGAAEMMDAASVQLAQGHGALVVAVDYRLAPETPFPGPVEDCYAALDWLFRNADSLGVDPSHIAIMGHSAGGGLAAATALLARDRGVYLLSGQILIYPMLDSRTGTPEALADNPLTGEFVWTREFNRFGWKALRGTEPLPPERLGHFSPAQASDVSRLPPAFIAVGALDLFLEEDVAYALRLARSGVPVDLHVYEGGIHGFDLFPGALATRFEADLRAALGRVLQGAPGNTAPQG